MFSHTKRHTRVATGGQEETLVSQREHGNRRACALLAGMSMVVAAACHSTGAVPPPNSAVSTQAQRPQGASDGTATAVAAPATMLAAMPADKAAAALVQAALTAPGPAQPPSGSAPAAAQTPPGPERCDPERDRAAILRMAGGYSVTFRFEEHSPLASGYPLDEPYESEATEVVSVLEDSATKVVLQHVLMIEKHDGSVMPLKHWRQDWTFQDNDLLEYQGQRNWAHRTLAQTQARCTWSQAVYQVDDAPRYESHGPWQHGDDGVSLWQAAPSFRPLPRREYTHRDDYDVIVAHNVHIVHEGGWEHVQRNLKWVSSEQRALVRERGHNRYERIALPAVQGTAESYLTRTADFWTAVRTIWSELLSPPTIHILFKRNDTALYELLFPLADSENGDAKSGAELVAQLRQLIGPFVLPHAHNEQNELSDKSGQGDTTTAQVPQALEVSGERAEREGG